MKRAGESSRPDKGKKRQIDPVKIDPVESLDHLQETCQPAGGEIEEVVQLYQRARTDAREVMTDLEETAKTCCELEAKLQEREEEVVALNAELKQEKETTKALRDDMKRLEESLKEKEALKADNKKLEEEKESLQKTVSDLTKEKEALTAQVERLKAEVEKEEQKRLIELGRLASQHLADRESWTAPITPATSRPRPHSPRPLDPSPIGRPLFPASFQGSSLDPIVDQVAPGTSLGSQVVNQVAPGLLDPPNPPVDPLAGQNPPEPASGPPVPLPYDFLLRGLPVGGEHLLTGPAKIIEEVNTLIEGWRSKTKTSWAMVPKNPLPPKCIHTRLQRAANVNIAKFEGEPQTACSACVKKERPCVFMAAGLAIPTVLPLPRSKRTTNDPAKEEYWRVKR